MASIIRNRKVVAESWRQLDAVGSGLPEGDLLVSLLLWRARRQELIARSGRVGVWLAPDDDPAALVADFTHLDLIAVHFPHFTDGRGYSTARLLRERYGWQRELRAIGDVQRDQLFYLSRCGFDAYAVKDGADVDDAIKAFDDFTDAYQTSVERPLPLFRRRYVSAPSGTDWS